MFTLTSPYMSNSFHMKRALHVYQFKTKVVLVFKSKQSTWIPLFSDWPMKKGIQLDRKILSMARFLVRSMPISEADIAYQVQCDLFEIVVGWVSHQESCNLIHFLN